MALFAGKLHKEIAALMEQHSLDLTIIDGMTAEQKNMRDAQNIAVINLQERHEAERKNWSDAMAAKEHLWALERSRLQGMVDQNKADAEKWRRLLYGARWHKGGSTEIDGRSRNLWERRTDYAPACERILLPEGENPND